MRPQAATSFINCLITTNGCTYDYGICVCISHYGITRLQDCITTDCHSLVWHAPLVPAASYRAYYLSVPDLASFPAVLPILSVGKAETATSLQAFALAVVAASVPVAALAVVAASVPVVALAPDAALAPVVALVAVAPASAWHPEYFYYTTAKTPDKSGLQLFEASLYPDSRHRFCYPRIQAGLPSLQSSSARFLLPADTVLSFVPNPFHIPFLQDRDSALGMSYKKAFYHYRFLCFPH